MTTLADAVAQLTAEFPLADDYEPASASLLIEVGEEIASTGHKEQPGALFQSRERAVATWLDHAQRTLRRARAGNVRFIKGPHLDSWPITITDSRRTHRVAGDWYSVSARLDVIPTRAEPAPVEARPAPKKRTAEAVK